MPDEVMGEKACAFIVPRPGDSVTLDEICEWLRENAVARLQPALRRQSPLPVTMQLSEKPWLICGK